MFSTYFSSIRIYKILYFLDFPPLLIFNLIFSVCCVAHTHSTFYRRYQIIKIFNKISRNIFFHRLCKVLSAFNLYLFFFGSTENDEDLIAKAFVIDFKFVKIFVQ